MYQLKVGGTRFVVTSGDVEKLGSPFLTTLLDPESAFAKPEDGIFVIEADAACFSAFLHMRRFGSLPNLSVAINIILEQADFWGIRKEVASQINLLRGKYWELTQNILLHEEAKKHHNIFKIDYSCGRSHCTDCDKGIRLYQYTNDCVYVECSKCKNIVKFNKRMGYGKYFGWCHKCELCINCQGVLMSSPCPFDARSNRDETTAELSEDIAKLKRELGLL